MNPNKDEELKDKIEKEFESERRQKWETKAQEYLNDKEKANDLLNSAVKKAEKRKKGPLGEIWDKVQLLFSIFKNWIDGSYRQVPAGSIIMIIIGLLYFVVPIDIIPDWIAGLGIVDDATVLGLIIKQVSDDLENYRTWKDNRDKQLEDAEKKKANSYQV